MPNPINVSSPIDMRKGRRVTLAGGAASKFPKYTAAWIDLAGKKTATLTPVLVLLDDGTYKEYRPKDYNVKDYSRSVPRNRTDAAFAQHPRLDELMRQLTRYLAKCSIDRAHDNGEVLNRFAHALDVANDELKKSPTKTLRQVVWPVQENMTDEESAKDV